MLNSQHLYIKALTYISRQNFLFYGLSYFANDWVARDGPGQMMYVFAVSASVVCVAALPFYTFGKRMRVWWAERNLFKRLKMETKGAVAEMG